LGLQAKEHKAAPARSSYSLGDWAERPVGLPKVVEAVVGDRYGVFDTLPFPHEARARGRNTIGSNSADGFLSAIKFLSKCLKALPGRNVQAAVGELLESVGQTVFKGTSIVRCGLCVKEIFPLNLKIVRGKGSEFRYPIQNRRHWV
jgi:hypothetical protein